MTYTVHKYPISVAHFQMSLPRGAEFLCVQTQRDEPQSWWLVRTDGDLTELREFIVHGTGHEVQIPFEHYLGTFQLRGGEFVGHLFEIKRGAR